MEVRFSTSVESAIPRVSIICPCFNAERYVGEAIESIRLQTFPDWEMVVVDDGSTDRSADAAGEHARRDPRIRVIRRPHRNMCAARNAGVAAAAGSELMMFLDADDRWRPEMLARLVEYLDAHPEVGAVYCGARFIDETGASVPGNPNRLLPRRAIGGRWKPRQIPDDEPETPFESIFTAAGIIPSLTMMRRSVFEQTSGFDEEVFGQGYGDRHLFLELALLAPIHRIPERLADYRLHSAQNTADPAKQGRQREKLLARWSDYEGLPLSQRETVRRAWLFLERQFTAANAVTRLACDIRRGRPLLGLRFVAGAARIVLRSLLFGPPPRRRKI